MELNNSEKVALLRNFKIDFEYDEVDYLENFNCFIVFNKERHSDNTIFLAKVYNNEGVNTLTIPFPHVEINHKEINVVYKWNWEVEKGVRLVFNTTGIIIDDFWHEFDLTKRIYTVQGKAY